MHLRTNWSRQSSRSVCGAAGYPHYDVSLRKWWGAVVYSRLRAQNSKASQEWGSTLRTRFY
jgi:hypothetical protein